ncbi:hypothetical protein [Gimesia panareensis]|uniref:hypothetical protein n=1 Tax=Gimesia panareensis TaxID=2527978 RepID=UPI00118B914D|nr:hypothetical protein [Gimesia panareensis]QDU51237.1 hypothetical protein Pan110_36010 [Gimesia panareensis]
MTTLDHSLPCPLQADSVRRHPNTNPPRASDLDRVLSFCRKRTTPPGSDPVEFPQAVWNELLPISRRFPSLDEASRQLMAELTVLGRQAIQTTAESLDPRLKQLASEYADGLDERRREICDELFHFLLTPTPPVRTQIELLQQIRDDFTNQSCNRIFPRQFTKHGNPNCLGRALILLGFARLAGATVLGATPLIPGSEIAIRHNARVARGILRHAKQHRVTLKPELISFLDFITERSETDRLRPPMFHMGIVIQTSDAGWTLIDPHAKVAGRYQSPSLISQIETHSRLHPEEIFAADFRSETDLKCSQQLWKLQSVTALLQQLQTLGLSEALHVDAALIFLAESNLLEYITSDAWNIPREEKEKIAAQLRGVQSPVIEHGLIERLLKRNYPQTTLFRIQALLSYVLLLDSGKEFVGLLAFDVSDDSQSLRQELLQGSFRDLLEELIARLHGFLFNTASLGSDRSLLHPVLELYQPEFRVGVELVSHVNAVTLRSEAISQALFQVFQGQTIQISRATEILRTPNELIPLSSQQAVDQLLAAEIKSDRLQTILERISLKLSRISRNRNHHDSESK